MFIKWPCLVFTFVNLSIFAAPTLTLSNSSLSADFNGRLTHTIGGITVGETVFVERFADLNANGAIDAGETSLRSFHVTDGAQTIIGGIRNQNVPADEDAAANGTIDLKLDFGGLSPFLNRQPGKYIIRVTATSGVAASPFEITAPNLPQRITGVVQSTTIPSVPVPHAIVVILIGDGSPVGSVRADANGVYNFSGAPGNYGLIPFADSFIGSFEQVTLSADQVANKTLLLNPASIRISGRLTDSVSNVGLPTVFVLAESENTISGALSDANGDYAFSVISGVYEVHPLSEFVSQLGYVSPNDVIINPSGSSLTVNFSLSKANALIYGAVTDTGNNNAPIPNLRMSADSQSAATDFEADGRTSSTGDYFIGVLNGDWRIYTEEAAMFGLRAEEHQITIAAGQAIRSDFALGRITAHLRGKVVNAVGAGIPNVQFQGRLGNQYNAAQTETDSEGNFDLSVWGGSWTFYLSNIAENGLIARELDLTIVDGVDQTITYVVPDPTGHINGIIEDYAGRPLGGVQINAQATINGVNYQSSSVSGGAGFTSFSLPAINGTWNISINCDDVESRGLACPQSQQITVNNNNPSVTITVPFPAGPPTIENPTLDRTGPSPMIRFTLRGDPATYEILGSSTIPGGWTFIQSATIPQGSTTTQVQINVGANRFFQARVQQ